MLLTLLGIGIIGALAYQRCAPRIWIPAAGLVLLVLTLTGQLNWLALLLAWPLYIAAAVVFSQTELRHHYLSKPVLKFFRKVLPPMSATEREALDAGDVWWDGDLFQGRPDWQKWLAMPKPALSAEEQAFLDNQVETLCAMLDDWKIVQRDFDLPKAVWDYLKKERFFGMAISKEYGGLGFSALGHSTVIVKIATRSCSAAVNSMVPNSLGPGELLQHYGTEEQKNYYLPRLAAGKEIPCFALTAPEAGSDAGSMIDKGIICKGMYDGKEVLGIRLTWDKRYITLAPVATVLGLAFKLYDPEGLFSAKKELGITVCLIPADHPGVEIGTRHCPMNMAFMNGPTRGKEVFVPMDWIIGGPAMAGQGWRMLMECLSIGRSISLPGLSAAAGKYLYRMTGAYARLRRQFKLSVGQFEGVEEVMARMGGYAYILEASRITTANAVDQQVKPSVVSAIAKYHMTEMLRQVTNDALDIHAGRGIQLGPRNYLGHGYLGVPVAITVEGANILTRNLIIFGQGAVRCHPYIRQEMAAAALTDEKQALHEFDKLLVGHIGYAVSNAVRCFVNGVTAARLIQTPATGVLKRYCQKLTRMSTALAFTSDLAMLMLGGDLKRKERLSARLGDVLSHLYLASAVIKYFHDHQQPLADIPYVEWALQTQLHHIQVALDEFFINFPNKLLGKVLRFIIFPLGRSFKVPRDKLGHVIARSMMVPSELRDRLSQYCYLNTDSNDPAGRIEHAFNLSIAAEPIEQKLHAAIKAGHIARNLTLTEQITAAVSSSILSNTEAELLTACEQARLDAMQVDEFEFNYFKRKA